jgi:hypothetical protein
MRKNSRLRLVGSLVQQRVGERISSFRVHHHAFDGDIDMGQRDGTPPQPLWAFPALIPLVAHEPWLGQPEVRAQCTWELIGWGGHRFVFYLIQSGGKSTLGVLMRDKTLIHYCQLYPDLALAALDSTLWAREILFEPEPGLLAGGGVDDSGQTWSVRVVRRQRRWEVHMTHGGLIPLISPYESAEEANLMAEHWITVFHHADDEDVIPSGR